MQLNATASSCYRYALTQIETQIKKDTTPVHKVA